MSGSRRARSRWGLLPLALAGAMMVTACDDEVAEPFEIEGTGGVEGLLFFDANEDGAFTPTAGDSALAGVDLVVRERSTEQAFNGASVTTGADGRFLVEALPPGTHDLLIDTLSVPAGVRFCQNPIPVTIYRHEVNYEPVDGRSSCLITIAEAEALAADAEYVTVAGVVTSSPGQITGSNTFVQDETGGVLVYGSLDPAIEVGDYIEVSGTITQYFTTLEITGPTLKSRVAGYGEVEPRAVTTGEIAASGGQAAAEIQGLLVTVQAAELTVAFGADGLNERNGKINDGTGQAEIRIYDGVVEDAATLGEVMSVGTCYDITGIVGDFSETAQIYPRTLDDIEEVPCT
jgi:DNA/RNA endonuclease YhcR with UshA esterase domain